MARLPIVDRKFQRGIGRGLCRDCRQPGLGLQCHAGARARARGIAAVCPSRRFARYHTALSDRQREIVILITGRGIDYAQTHHGPLGRQAGLSDAELSGDWRRAGAGELCDRDAALARLILEVIGRKAGFRRRLCRCPARAFAARNHRCRADLGILHDDCDGDRHDGSRARTTRPARHRAGVAEAAKR